MVHDENVAGCGAGAGDKSKSPRPSSPHVCGMTPGIQGPSPCPAGRQTRGPDT